MNLYKLLMYQEHVCHDPDHDHEVPLQKMALIQVLDQKFEVTQDGDRYKARSDDGLEVRNIDRQGVMKFIGYCLSKVRG